MQLQRSSLFSLLIVCGLILVTGCAKYRPKPLPEIFEHTNAAETSKSDLSVYAYELTAQESQTFFSRNAPRKGYHPVHLSIKNNSKKSFMLRGSKIDLVMEQRYVMIDVLKIDVMHRVMSWGLPGLIFGVLLIPAVVEGLCGSAANRKMRADFERRVIDSYSTCIIKPGCIFSCVFFLCGENWNSTFNITLEDLDTKTDHVVNVHIER